MNYALVGAFVLLLLASLIGGVLWIASGGRANQQPDLYLAIARESVSGLSVNAPVKYNGVDVGKVQSIELDPVNPEVVRLTFALRRGTPVKVDTEAMLKMQGLTGIASVELSGGKPNSPLLRASSDGSLPVIPTKPSLSARLENVLGSVLQKLDGTTTRIDEMLGPKNQKAFASMLADLSALARTLAARRQTVDAGLVSAARTFDNSARVTAQLDEQIGPMLERVSRAADSIDKLGKEGAQASSQVGATVQAAGPELQKLLTDLQVLSASLRRLSEQLERNPSSVLLGRTPTPPGPGETARPK